MTAKIRTRFLLSVAALAVSLAAPAPAAVAEDFAFEPGAFAKAHAPLHQAVQGNCEQFQCGQTDVLADAWAQPVIDAPELTQAAAHPDFSVHFSFENVGALGEGGASGDGHVRTVLSDAPAGAVGNPLAVPRCEAADFHLSIYGACPKESQVGLSLSDARPFFFLSPVSSLVPASGQPALLGFKSFAYTAILTPEVRSDGDYGLRVTADPLPVPLTDIYGNTITLWGVPYDPVHDAHRVNDVGVIGAAGSHIPGSAVPFLSAPTNCSSGPVDFTLKARTWEAPDKWIETTSTAPEPTGCDQIKFTPSLSAQPSTNVADSPTGLEVDVHTPQNNSSCKQIKPFPPITSPQYDCGLATSHLKDTTVALPEGLTLNPSGANGLDGCSPAEIGLSTPLGVSPQQFTKAPPNCPDASRIAGVEVDTPLLDQPMPGSVYIADPYENPFRSLLAIYVVADDQERGIIVKLAGKVSANPLTGQLTTTVTDAPQLPFEHFLLHFQQGPYAALRTPACGDYSTTAELTPYSAPGSPVPTNNDWSITQGPGGGCDQPNSPSLDAGTISPIAASYTPGVITLRRDDGSQQFKTVTLSPPPGMLGKLAGIPACSEAQIAQAQGRNQPGDGAAEQADPSCPAASQVGTVDVAAGAGPSPYNAQGNVYLAPPYKGAPLSLAIVTPATAGPFDLGTVVIRTALHIDPATVQITAVSDEIPSILDGIPLDVRTAAIKLDRDQFIRTGTSCDELAFSGSLLSTLDQSAPLSERFQLAECTSLGFKPQMSLKLRGATKRSRHPQLTVVLKPRAGDANIASLQLALPRSEFLDQAHIRTVCTRVQFAADTCPQGAIYGEATVDTPILDYPLSGHVYLRSSDNLLPDLVPDLRGPAYQPIRVESAGRTDSIHGGIRNTFDFIPDAPFTKLVTRLQGGNRGLLVNSRDICARTYRATVTYTAHNGKAFVAHPKLRAQCGKAKRGKRGGHKRGSRIAHRSAVVR